MLEIKIPTKEELRGFDNKHLCFYYAIIKDHKSLIEPKIYNSIIKSVSDEIDRRDLNENFFIYWGGRLIKIR